MTVSIAEERGRAVAETVARIRARAGPDGAPDRAALEDMAAALGRLAARADLFPRAEFPATGDEEADTHELSRDPGGRLALYLFSGGSVAETPPHDHATWALIAGVEGEEHNRIYRRLDDGSVPGRGRIELAREVSVGPRDAIALAVEDVHSIHARPGAPLLHLHMYGVALELQAGRVRFDTVDGTTAPYGFGDAGANGETDG